MDSSILEQQDLYFPLLGKAIQELKTYHQEKLWHQLSESLLKYCEEPVLAEGRNLLDLYEGFIKDFEGRIDQIKLMKLIIKISDQLPSSAINIDEEEGINFLEQLKSKTLKDEQAIILCNLKQGVFHLRKNDFDASKKIISDMEKRIERIDNIDSFVYSFFHKFCAHYYQQRGNHEGFYKHSLQYLAYTPETSLKKEEKEKISLEMGIAVLVSKKIYNFSELLEQPVLKELESTHLIIYQLLKLFNNGDVDGLNKVINDAQASLDQYVLLKQNPQCLFEKIRIMAFLDLIFSLPKNDRQVSFDLITRRTKVSPEEVELLVMRAMSLELVKGSIDEIEKMVKITWIMPRILDKERIGIMKDKIEQWNKSLGGLLETLEKYELV